MKFLLPLLIFSFIFRDVLGHWIYQEGIEYDEKLSYQELINLNKSCYPFDSCMEKREKDPPVHFSDNCSCNRTCFEYGTCCIDSPYRDLPPIQKCRYVGGVIKEYGYYMVNKCPYNTNTYSVWKNKCENEWNEEDDISLISPVTSLDTAVTYKNYFCFRCHEATDKYISWNLLVESVYNVSEEVNVYSVAYSKQQKSWMAILDENGISIPANITFEFPFIMQAFPTSCSLLVIEDCPQDWTDRLIHEKCLAYTADVFYGILQYKNVHCALCNGARISDLTCRQTAYGGYGYKDIFSFRRLFNINDAIGDKVGSDGKCEDGHTWDPYSKKCRKNTCAVPGYVIKNNRCALP